MLHIAGLCSLLMLSSGTLTAGDVPFLAGRVNDNADILSPATERELDRALKAHEDTTSNQLIVLTVESLGGEAIEEYSIRVAETWKPGQKGKDNGVLLIVARDDRAVRIEVGRGLEGDLPDITCGMIIRNDIIPEFRNGDYDGGVRAGVYAILGVIGGTYEAGGDGTGERQADLIPRIFAFLLFLVVVGIFTILGIVTRGCHSWFLYLFLIPFWSAFPSLLLGPIPGGILLLLYLVVFPVAKVWLTRSGRGKELAEKLTARGALFGGTWRGGSSTGGRSSGGGFSGGGGGFSGGGASGRW